MCLTGYGYHTGYVYHTKSVLVGIGVSVFVLRKGKRVGHAQGEWEAPETFWDESCNRESRVRDVTGQQLCQPLATSPALPRSAWSIWWWNTRTTCSYLWKYPVKVSCKRKRWRGAKKVYQQLLRGMCVFRLNHLGHVSSLETCLEMRQASLTLVNVVFLFVFVLFFIFLLFYHSFLFF